MSEGPFKSSDFRYCVEGMHALSSMFDDPNAIDKNKCAETANNHPFVKEAREKMEYILESDDSTMESRHVAKTFLSKYFPEKESGG